jgi:hypothetical protein
LVATVVFPVPPLPLAMANFISISYPAFRRTTAEIPGCPVG